MIMCKKSVFDIKFVDTNHQWVDIFTKPLSGDPFVCIREHLNIVGPSN